MRTRSGAMVLAAVVTLSAVVAPLAAARLEVSGFRHADPRWESLIEIALADVPGATGVTAVTPDGTPLVLNAVSADTYAAWSGPFASFASFHVATVGDWQLTVQLAAGDAVYNFTVNDYRTPFTDADFPPAPTMIDPTDGAAAVSPTPTFQWNNGGPHTGPMESLFVSVASLVEPGVGELQNSFAPGLDLNDQSWTPSISLPAGLAQFLVQYETNLNEDANLADPIFNPVASTVPDPAIAWNETFGDLFSRDQITFTVVPEPAAATALLLAAGLLARRRRPAQG